MKKYLVEFIGTFFLVMAVVLAANTQGNLAPLAIGATLMVMIYAGGHISGGHFNPAVSVAVYLRGKLDRGDLLPYIASQIFGGIIGSAVALFFLGCLQHAGIAPRENDPICALAAEFIGTFALAWVVLNVATTKSNAGNSHYGLAIGFTVMAMAYTLGGVSGGAFNPAVGVGISVAGMANWNDLWIYLVGTVLGAAAASTVFTIVYGRED